jgi:hypothetical protein
MKTLISTLSLSLILVSMTVAAESPASKIVQTSSTELQKNSPSDCEEKQGGNIHWVECDGDIVEGSAWVDEDGWSPCNDPDFGC